MITSYDELASIRKKNTKKIVFVGGCFDLLHIGHLDFFSFAKLHGEILVVGVVPDKRIRQRKGPDRPIHTEDNRLAIVNALEDVDYTFIMPSATHRFSSTVRVLSVLKPDIFVEYHEAGTRLGSDFIKLIAEYGTKLIIDMSPKRESTTGLIKKIQNNFMKD